MRYLAVLALACLMSGCLPTVVAVSAYKMAQNRTYNEYRIYVAQTQRDNQTRIDGGLKPLPIKTLKQWEECR